MNQAVLNHLDNTLGNLRILFEKAITRIEAIKPGEKIPATKLASDLAEEIGQTGPQLYPCLLWLFKEYPGIEIRKGAHGGLRRVLPSEAKPLVSQVSNITNVVLSDDVLMHEDTADEASQ